MASKCFKYQLALSDYQAKYQPGDKGFDHKKEAALRKAWKDCVAATKTKPENVSGSSSMSTPVYEKSGGGTRS